MRWFVAIAALVVGAILLWQVWPILFGASDVERKGAASDITEWVKLGISLVSLAIGVVNLRLALAKADKSA